MNDIVKTLNPTVAPQTFDDIRISIASPGEDSLVVLVK